MKPPTQKWEHMEIKRLDSEKSSELETNPPGLKGWECYAVTARINYITYYFKRPILEDPNVAETESIKRKIELEDPNFFK